MGKTDIEILYNEVVDMVDINSIQLRYLLENYVCSPSETRVPQIWIDFVVSGANQVSGYGSIVVLIIREQCPGIGFLRFRLGELRVFLCEIL